MIFYYFIDIALIEILKSIVSEFEKNGGYVCLTTVEPPEDIAKPRKRKPTGIIAQEGELFITRLCKGFALEGDLDEYGYRKLALSLGCQEFKTSEEFLAFIQTINQK